MAPARLTATATGATLPGGSVTIAAETVVDADLDARRVTLTALRGTVTTAPEATPIAGTVGMSGAIDYDLAHARLRAERVDLTAELRGAALPGGAATATLSTRTTADLTAETAALDDLRLRVLDLDLQGSLKLANWRTAPAIAGEIEVAPFAARKLLDRLGQAQPQCADPKVLGRASLKAKVDATPTTLRLGDLVVVLDDSKLTGTVAVNGFDRPAVRGDLALDALDVDRYLPPPAKGKAPSPPPATPGATAGAASELPLDTLRALDLDTTMRIGRLKLANVRVSDVILTTTAKGGEIHLHPATAHLYGGEYRGDARVDARGPEPVVRLDETLTGVNAGPLLRDALGEERVTGKATLHAQVTGRGTGVDAITHTARGTAEFRVADGAVRGVNLGRLLREARAALALTKGQGLAPVREVEETDFTELTGTLTIAEGKVRNEDLAGKSPLLRISGVGEVDLVREEVDYLLTVTVVETRTGQGGKELDDLAGIPIPVRISGPFAKLEYRPDLRGVIKERAATAAQKRLKKELDKRLKDKVPEDLRKDLEQGLKGLFP
jgi:AsmA protein